MKGLKLTKPLVFKIIAYAAMFIIQLAMFISVSNRRCGDMLTQMVFLVIVYDIIALVIDLIGTKGKGNPLLYCIPGIIITFGATTQAVVNPLYDFYYGLTDYTKTMYVSLVILFVSFIIGKWLLTISCKFTVYNILFIGTIALNIGTCLLRLFSDGGFYSLYVLSITPYIITISIILNSAKTSELFIFKKLPISKKFDDSEYQLIISIFFSACCFIPLVIVGEWGTLLVEACIYIIMLVVYSSDIHEAFVRILKDKKKRITLLIIIAAFIAVVILTVIFTWKDDIRPKIERIFDLFKPLEQYSLTQQQKARVNIFNGGAFGLSDLANMKRTKYGGSDMVFQSLCQVWGYVGGLCVVALYVVWAVIAFKVSRLTFSFGDVASKNYNSISRLFCVGNIVSILAHVFINVGSNTGAFPVCGICLPLISKGGSSMIPVVIGIALVWHRDYYCKICEHYDYYLGADKSTKQDFCDEIKEKLVAVWNWIKNFFRSKKLKTALRVIGGLFAIVILIAIVGLVSAAIMIEDIAKSVNHIEVDGLGTTAPAAVVSDMELVSNDSIVNILVLGTDKEKNGHSRSDAILVLSINTDDNTIKYIQFARDSYVEIPGRDGRYKLTAAYSYGGAQLTAETIEANFRISLDGVCTFTFESVAEIIDDLGGVSINITKAEAEEIALHVSGDIEIKDGAQTLTGAQAVYYARIRSLDDNFGREDRQRKLMNAVIKKIASYDTLDLVFQADDLAENINSSFTKSEIKNLFFEVIDIMLEKKQNSKLAKEAMVGVSEETEELVRALYANKDISEEDLEDKIKEETNRVLSKIAKQYKSETNGSTLIIDDYMKIPIEQHAANRTIDGESVLELYVPYNAEEIIEFIYGKQEA